MKISCALLVSIALLWGSNSVDAAGCKYRAPYSGNTIVAGKAEQARLLAAAERWTPWKSFRTWGNEAKNHGWTNGMVDGDKKYLGLKINLVEVPGGASITAGAPLWVLMVDESIVELAADTTLSDKDSANIVFARYELTEETHAALLAQGVTDIRVTTSIGEIDFYLGKTKKPSGKVQESLGCI
jgi:hypothetical protein